MPKQGPGGAKGVQAAGANGGVIPIFTDQYVLRVDKCTDQYSISTVSFQNLLIEPMLFRDLFSNYLIKRLF